MRKIFIILGNGFTIDFLNHYRNYHSNSSVKINIDVTNLFKLGEKINTPWDNKPGFLSYKNCPALWTLGARPNQTIEEASALIEEIISCANMFFDFVTEPEQKAKRLSIANSSEKRIYLKAYCELSVYLRQLFSWYNSIITDSMLNDFIINYHNWGWLNYFKSINTRKNEKIIFVTYNYDIWLERIFDSLGLEYNIIGFTNESNRNIDIIKPHGSISFVPLNYTERFEINYNLDVEGLRLDDLRLQYENLTKYSVGALIPPSGDSSRLNSTSSWAKDLRNHTINYAKEIAKEKDNHVIMCGISYWHVDRRELDEVLINLNYESDFTFINPLPPRDLNAVLTSIFDNYILQTTSDNIGEIING